MTEKGTSVHALSDLQKNNKNNNNNKKQLESLCSKPLAPLKQNKRNKGVLKTFAQYCTWIRLGLDVL